jgi:RNA recognition motif-containing protein
VVSPPELKSNAAKFNSADKHNQQPNPSNVLGVFGLSIRTQERDLEDEFSRFGRVEKVTIVYDQRVSHGRLYSVLDQLTPALVRSLSRLWFHQDEHR